jgi:hypothetical protein
MGSYTMKDITVHKEGEEGTVQVRGLDGKIITPIDLRPDWAEGLTTAFVQDRLSFYEKRFGKETEAFKQIAEAEAVEFSDLGWIGMHATGGDEFEVFADHAYRSEVIAKALGIDTEAGTFSGNVLAEREVSRENRGRTQAEIEALAQSVNEGFVAESTRQETERERQTAHR